MAGGESRETLPQILHVETWVQYEKDEIWLLNFTQLLYLYSNQFGHQTNENDAEFPNTLKYVRPGGGFEFKGELFACSKVNGELQVALSLSLSLASPCFIRADAPAHYNSRFHS